MGMTAIATVDGKKYGKLLARTLPRVIQNDAEFDRMVALMESIDLKKDATPEERALAELLMKLVLDYDDNQFPVLESTPDKALRALMDQRKLKQVDLVPVLGSRAQVSAAVNGTRGISKAQAKKLAEFFHCSIKLFI